MWPSALLADCWRHAHDTPLISAKNAALSARHPVTVGAVRNSARHQDLRDGCRFELLCVNHSTRSPEFPDAPTLTQAGYPNSDVPLWFCILAPAGTPQPIVDALHAKVTEISKAPDVPARLLLSGSLPVTSTQAELVAFRDAEWKSTSDLIKAANIKLE